MRKAGLGRGLSALMDEVSATTAGSSDSLRVPIARIAPHAGQPRRRFDAAAMAELIESVRERGILQPILVRPAAEGRYEIVAGERRWRAAQAAGLHEMPVIVRDLSDSAAFEIALIENIQRADLNAVEEAQGYRQLINAHGHTQEAIAQAVGKSRSHVANLLRLLDLPEALRIMLADGQISMGHARALLTAPDPEGLAQRVVAQGWSVRQTEAAAKKGEATPEARPRVRADRDPNIGALEAQLSEALGSRVTIVADGTSSAGEVHITFADLDQLDLICARLTGAPRF